MADPNQTPQRGNWVCPCNGCKKAAKQVIDQIIDEYKTCLNVEQLDDKLYCTVWYKHDDCERLRELLFRITNDSKYLLPEFKMEVNEALFEIMKDPKTKELLDRLGSDYDENKKPYWEQ